MEKIHRRIARTKPDVVVNFYKLLGGLTNLRYREHIPFIHIGHQFLLNHPDYPFGKSDEQGYLFLRLHAIFNKIGATKTLALSFYPMKDHLSERIAVVPPLIRKEVREVQVRNEDYLLVYILNQGYEEEIRQWHTRHPETWLICFWDKNAPDKLEADQTLTFYTIDDEKFLHFMAGCKGYVSTAGFESICEAFYLSKPVMVVPSHVEQEVNAADAASTGKAVVHSSFDLDKLTERLQQPAPQEETFRRWIASAEEICMRHLTTFV